MGWTNLSDEKYRFRWQCWFSSGARANGMKTALAARLHVSQLRHMHRCLRGEREVTRHDLKRVFARAGSRNIPGRWIIDRCKDRLLRALNRGDSKATLERRGNFDPLRGHSQFRGSVRARRNGSKRRAQR
jgi:hypothetical protein